MAIVRGHGSTWNSPHCRCDLSVLAVLAPALEKSLSGRGKMSQEKRAPGWLGYIGDDKLPIYIGIIINHNNKDPY